MDGAGAAITGVACGARVETVADPTMREICYLAKPSMSGVSLIRPTKLRSA